MKEINEYHIVSWLHEEEDNPALWGWSLSKHNTSGVYAIIFRVPPFFLVEGAKCYTTREHVFFNKISVPIPKQSLTVVLDLNPVESLVVGTSLEDYEECREQILSDLSTAPLYFEKLSQVVTGQEKASILSEDVWTVMTWETPDVLENKKYEDELDGYRQHP